MTYTYEISCFNLQQIAQSGQCFRMSPIPIDKLPEQAALGYRIISGGRLLSVFQNGFHVTFQCPKEALGDWLAYFDWDLDYENVIGSIDQKDAYLLAAAEAGQGIRILRQDPWEMIITFLISQQKTIPKIRELVEALCRAYGSPITAEGMSASGDTAAAYYAFPTPEQLSRASLDDLLALKLGYRAKYIHRVCQDAVNGRLDLEELKEMDYKDAMEYLTGFYGIGKKVANCVCLFGLHHIDAFPVDTWIEKILMEHYCQVKKYRRTPKALLFDKIIEDSFGQYGGYAGIMQQYIFYYERLKNGRLG